MDFLKMHLQELQIKKSSILFFEIAIDDILLGIVSYERKAQNHENLYAYDLRPIKRGYMYLYLFGDLSLQDFETAMGESFSPNVFSSFITTLEWRYYFQEIFSEDLLLSMTQIYAVNWRDEKTGFTLSAAYSRAGGSGRIVSDKKHRKIFAEILSIENIENIDVDRPQLQKKSSILEFTGYTQNEWRVYYASIIDPKEFLTTTLKALNSWYDKRSESTFSTAYGRCIYVDSYIGVTYKNVVKLLKVLYAEDPIIQGIEEKSLRKESQVPSEYAAYTKEDWICHFRKVFTPEQMITMSIEEYRAWQDSDTGIRIWKAYSSVGGKGRNIEYSYYQIDFAHILFPDDESVRQAYVDRMPARFLTYGMKEWKEYFSQIFTPEAILQMTIKEVVNWKDPVSKLTFIDSCTAIGVKESYANVGRRQVLFAQALFPKDTGVDVALKQLVSQKFRTYTTQDWIVHFSRLIDPQTFLHMHWKDMDAWRDPESGLSYNTAFVRVGGEKKDEREGVVQYIKNRGKFMSILFPEDKYVKKYMNYLSHTKSNIHLYFSPFMTAQEFMSISNDAAALWKDDVSGHTFVQMCRKVTGDLGSCPIEKAMDRIDAAAVLYPKDKNIQSLYQAYHKITFSAFPCLFSGWKAYFAVHFSLSTIVSMAAEDIKKWKDKKTNFTLEHIKIMFTGKNFSINPRKDLKELVEILHQK